MEPFFTGPLAVGLLTLMGVGLTGFLFNLAQNSYGRTSLYHSARAWGIAVTVPAVPLFATGVLPLLFAGVLVAGGFGTVVLATLVQAIDIVVEMVREFRQDRLLRRVSPTESTGALAPPAPEPTPAPGPTDWEVATAREGRVLDLWADYATDLDLLLRQPLMQDLHHPVVRRAVRAAGKLQDARPQSMHEPKGFDMDHRYAVAGREAEETLDAAVALALRHGTRKLPQHERVTIERARKLLAQALDPTIPETERRLFYGKVRDLLEGVVAIPTRASAALEARIAPAITAVRT